MDPDVATTGEPYEYATDDPVNTTDPDGLCTLGICAITDVGHAVKKAAKTVAHAAKDVGHAAASAAHYVTQHKVAIGVIAASAAVVVGATVLTGGLADVMFAAGAELAEEGALGELDAVELALHAPFVLAPSVTLGGLGLAGIGYGIYTLSRGSSGGSTSAPFSSSQQPASNC